MNTMTTSIINSSNNRSEVLAVRYSTLRRGKSIVRNNRLKALLSEVFTGVLVFSVPFLILFM